MSPRPRFRVILLAASALAACETPARDAPEAVLRPQPLSTPAGAGSGEPWLAVDDAGRALLTWLEAADSGAVLRMAALNDTAWSEPRTVAADRDFIVNWADFPSLLPLGGERLAVHWLEREGSGTYAYGVRIAFSDDGGRTWSEPIRPHTDSTQTEHGFVSMLPARDGAVDAIWLDGRNFEAGRPEMTLRAARVGPTSIDDEAVVDARICDCCQTDAARTADGIVVVYRDRTADEIRDIAIARRGTDGVWSEPGVVHADGWQIDGCPVNGPAVAADGDRVAVAWFTAARDTAKVLVAFSRDGGATFDAPIRIDDGDPVGRVDVVMNGDGAFVSWIEQRGGGADVRLRRAAAETGAGGATTIASVAASRAAGFPRMAMLDGAIVIAWTDAEAGTVRTARVATR